jgi:uncharacterized protein YegL
LPPPAPPPAPTTPLAPAASAAGSVAWSAPVSITAKAGEWDDNANWREFVRWLRTEDRLPFHRLDVTKRRFLVVRDRNGRPVPGCAVDVSDGRASVRLRTTASGRAVLFPRAEGLTGASAVATTACGQESARAQFSLADDEGVVDLPLPSARALPALRTLDVAFVLDTTGSMSEEIAAVKATIQSVARSLQRSDLRVRIGMVAYKDRGDEYVTATYPMTSDLAAFARDVATIQASGGGDMPESVNAALHTALGDLEWDRDAVAQLAFLVGDAPPHLDYANDADYALEARRAARAGIEVFTIAASGMDDLGQVVWRQIAQYTGATNMFVLRGGAGPQSTGAGDPKSSCGGTQQSYRSGDLDKLVLAKIKRELDAVDRDPMRIAGLGQDEDAKPCKDRLIAGN